MSANGSHIHEFAKAVAARNGAIEVVVRDAANRLPELSENRTRRVTGVVRPRSADEVRQVVLCANELRVPLYPFSTGLNWGLGSGTPVEDDCVQVDLSRMNRIRELDLDTGYAVIEPGVSQKMLADRLAGSPYLLNVTTSCQDSSILGNALERGQGTFRLRAEELIGVDAVLGNGTPLRTGGIGSEMQRRYFTLGTGPDATQLFCQSNLGVVTSGTIALIDRTELTHFAYGAFDGAALAETIEVITRLRRQELIRDIFYFGEIQIQPSAPRALPSFTILGPIRGRRAVVEAAVAVLKEELTRIPGCQNLRIRPAEEVPADEPIYARSQMFLGTPSCQVVRGRFATNTCSLDESARFGWSVVQTPFPPDAKSVREVLAVLHQIVEQYGLPILPSMSSLTTKTMNLMAFIWFERTPAEIEKMRALRDALRAAMRARGFFTSRDTIDALRTAQREDPTVEAFARIKMACDPNGIIAPGRYINPRQTS